MGDFTAKHVFKDTINNQKYRLLIFSLVALFIGLLIIVVINFELSRRTTATTAHMDLIGEISDVMFQIASDTQQLALIDGTNFEQANKVITNLKSESKQVDDYLTELQQYPQHEDYLAKFNQQWQIYRNQINSLKLQKYAGVGDLGQRRNLAQYSYEQKQPLYDLLADGYDVYLQRTYQYGNFSRILQLLTLISILSFLIFFIRRTFRQILLSDKLVERSQQETQEIMENVNEGLFLINKDLVIGEQYSARLETMLHQSHIAGRTLDDVLNGMISAADMSTMKMFIEQLYNPWVLEELIQDLNPLKETLITYLDNDGITSTKFLSFNFLRVLDKDENINKVFVTVQDITNEIKLQRQMEQTREDHNRQIEMISYLLTVNVDQLAIFINESKQRIERMNTVLKDSNTSELQNKARQLFRDTHSLKGDASAMKLQSVVTLAEKQESKLKTLLENTNLKGNDFLPFTIGLNELLDMIHFMENLLNRLNLTGLDASTRAALATTVTPQPAVDVPVSLPKTETYQPVEPAQSMDQESDSFSFELDNTHPLESVDKVNIQPAQASKTQYWHDYFKQYAMDVATRQGKQVDIHIEGFEDAVTDSANMTAYKDIAMQLVKNAIVHGIETPEQRTAMGKPAQGSVILSLHDIGDRQQLSIHDDGHGINWQKIRQKAIESGQVTAEQATQLTGKDLMRLMFSSGISTADKQDEDAGRGVGMDIVRELTQDLHGKLSLNSKLNESTHMVFTFPK